MGWSEHQMQRTLPIIGMVALLLSVACLTVLTFMRGY